MPPLLQRLRTMRSTASAVFSLLFPNLAYDVVQIGFGIKTLPVCVQTLQFSYPTADSIMVLVVSIPKSLLQLFFLNWDYNPINVVEDKD